MAEIPLGKLAETLGAEVDQVMRAATIATFNGVVNGQRVDTGRLKGSFQTTAGMPAQTDVERIDPNGTAALTEIVSTVQGPGKYWISSNLEYAEIWEEREGVIARNAARVERNLREKARQYR